MASVLGLDFSTQQVKAVVLDESYRVTHRFSVNFEKDLPQYKTTGGVHIHADGRTVTAPTLMWVEALDTILQHMQRQADFDFSRIKAISGCGQQHASVYWRTGSEELLKTGLKSSVPLKTLLSHAFSIADSPVWMDSSTTKQCEQLERGVGGAQKLVELTGARAYERFTGAQIAKLSKTPEYSQTERISLVSSFVPSVLLGKYAPIDLSDGSGMNLLNLSTKTWDPLCMRLTAPDDLHAKLGEPVFSCTSLGKISKYFVERYGFREECEICAFTGDNPASLLGMHLTSSREAAISLGTSDTTFSWLNERPKNSSDFLDAVTFCNPLKRDAYMSLICWKNGSLTRENLKAKLCPGEKDEKSWDKFADLLQRSPPGNDGKIGFYFEQMEIQPHAKGTWRFDADDKSVEIEFAPENEARALIESQMMAKKAYLSRAGVDFKEEAGDEKSRIILTGGASQNKAIAQIVADIFQANVYTQTLTDSAAYGGACIAAEVLGWKRPSATSEVGVSGDDGLLRTLLTAAPRQEYAQVYEDLLRRFEMLQKKFVETSQV